MQKTYSDLTFKVIVESMPSAVVLMNSEGNITFVNTQTEKLFGYNREELIGQKIEILIPGRFRHHHPKLRDGFFHSPGIRAMGADRELYALHKDGREIPVEIGLNPMKTDSEFLVLASIIDITERKSANEKIIHANRLYSFLSHINQTIVHSTDKKSLFNEACRIAIEVGKFKMAWIGIANKEAKTIDLVAQRGFGNEDISLFTNFSYEKGIVLEGVLETGEHYVCNNVELEFGESDWKAILLSRNCKSFIVLPVKRGGITVGVFGLAADITHFFSADEMALLREATEDISFAKDVFEVQLERERVMIDLVERNKDLEQFAHILSHNVRAPLTTLLGLTMLAKEGLAQDEHEKVLDGIETSAHLLDKVIDDLNKILHVKRDLAELKVPIQLQDVCDEVTHMLTTFISDKGVEINTDFSGLTEITSVRSFINSIFFNLMSNAIKYSNPEVKPEIHISSEQRDGRQYLRFKDNGLGIDMDKYSSQVFSIYQRFHSGIEGRGIGLFMVKSQVESLKGKIELDSKPGAGSTFTISFPQ